METIAKLHFGAIALDITIARTESAVTLRIGDEDSRWRAERAAGPAAAANVWRSVKAAAHRAVADYVELGVDDEHQDAASAVYVEVGSLGVVRAELCAGESPNATVRLMTKVARRLAGREATVFDRHGRKLTVAIPE